jgi:hypothetical protein
MDYKFKTTNIKGKEYVEVNQRLLYFRKESKYEGWTIDNDLVAVDSESCVIKSTIRDNEGRVIASAHAQEDRTSSHINKTSFVENCETSAVGRALAMLGIGIETSIASSNEVSMAIAKQDQDTKAPSKGTESVYTKAVAYIGGGKDQEERKARFEKTLEHYGKALTTKEAADLKKLTAK